MALKLYRSGFENAKRLIKERQCVLDQRTDWTDHRPPRAAENRFIVDHGMLAFGRWHLAVDDEWEENDKRRFKFPFGDFVNVHRCAIFAAQERAADNRYTDIEAAVVQLHSMLDDQIVAKAS